MKVRFTEVVGGICDEILTTGVILPVSTKLELCTLPSDTADCMDRHSTSLSVDLTIMASKNVQISGKKFWVFS